MAAGVVGLMGSAYVAGKIENDKDKTPPDQLKLRQKLMFVHEVDLCGARGGGKKKFSFFLAVCGIAHVGPAGTARWRPPGVSCSGCFASTKVAGFFLCLLFYSFFVSMKEQQLASTATHTALYGALAFMPVSGLMFGYLSGWGVPFFVVDPGNIEGIVCNKFA